METTQFQEDLNYVKQMIENNRRSLIDNGMMYISNGIFIAVGVIASYILGMQGRDDLLPYLWLPIVALLLIVNFFIQKKKEKNNAKKTFISKIFDAVWMACGIPILIITILHFTTNTVSLTGMFVAVSAVLGIAYYLTGVINDLGFMKILAFGWWSGTVLSVLWNYIGEEYQLALLFSVLVLLLEVIPGIVIHRKYKRLYNE